MIAELGHFCLVMALLVAAVQTILPALGAHWREPRLMALAEPAALTQLALLTLAFLGGWPGIVGERSHRRALLGSNL